MIRSHSWKNFLFLVALYCFIKLFNLYYSRVKATCKAKFYMVKQFQIFLAKIGSKRFLFIWSEKKFPPFKLFATGSLRSCLPNWFTLFHMVIQYPWTSTGCCKTFNFFFWLIFLVSSPPSLTPMRLSHSYPMNSSEWIISIPSFSIPSSSSSAITTFYKELSSSMKPWFFFKKRIKQVNILEPNTLDFISFMFVSLALSKTIVTKVNKITSLVNWN